MPTADDFINESKKIFLQRMLTLDFFLLLRAKSENLSRPLTSFTT